MTSGRLHDLDVWPTQAKFITDINDPKIKHPAFIGGYGSGKTFVFVLAAITLAHINKGLIGLLMEPTHRMLIDVLCPEMESQLEAYQVPYTFKKTEMEYRLGNGSVIKLRSAEAIERTNGINAAWGGVDEVSMCSPRVWKVLLARIRIKDAPLLKTFAVGTPEPPRNGTDWVFDKWGDPKNIESGYIAHHADTRENLVLADEYYHNVLASLSPEEQIMYLSGQFLRIPLSGRVYKQFSEKWHTEHTKYNPKLKLIISCDFNVDPCVWIAGQYDGKKDSLTILREFVLRDTNTIDMLAAVNDWLAVEGIDKKSVLFTGDASGDNRNTASDHTNYDHIRHQYGRKVVILENKNPNIEPSVGLTNAKMRDSKIIIDHSCEMLIADLNRVIYKAGENKISKADANLTHASDGYRYIIWFIWGRQRKAARAIKSPLI